MTKKDKIDAIDYLLDDRSLKAEELLENWDLTEAYLNSDKDICEAISASSNVDFLLVYVKKYYEKYNEFFCIN